MSSSSLDVMFKRLHLAYSRRHWSDVVRRAEEEEWTYQGLLETLISEEIAHRAQTGVQRRIRRAKFPFLKTIEEFDFSFQSTLKATMLGSYLGHELTSHGRCLILHGRPGRGKTHLAIGIAHKAIINGYDALFINAAELIEELHAAANEGCLREAVKAYVAPSVLVVDEVGYLSLPANAANVLYHVVNGRYLKQKAMLFTTNKALTEWGTVLHDDDLAETILDRVLERGRIITLDGVSRRNPAGIGGADRTEAST